ncbi:MAG: hypothetical protein WC736_15335 [Gallionella sp.]|jgi:hypothetical protein
MSDFLILRRDLVANAITAIKDRYADKLADVQAVQDGDGKILKTINWGAFTPRCVPVTFGYLPQWAHQEIELELRASVDYQDRTLDSRYQMLLQVFEDFCALTNLQALLSGSTIKVQSPPTFDGIDEAIENGRYVTTYRLRCSTRGLATGE